jgi:hypothetical protein
LRNKALPVLPIYETTHDRIAHADRIRLALFSPIMAGVQIKPGRKIAIAVQREWYESVAKHRFLKEEPP